MFTFLKMFGSGLPLKIALIVGGSLLIGLLSVIGVLYYQNSNYKTDLSTKTTENANLLNNLNSHIALLDAVQKEAARLRGIEIELRDTIANAKPVIVERIKYVKDYSKDTSVPKSTISSKWVRLHNMLASSPYTANQTDSAGGSGCSTAPTATNNCWPEDLTVTDDVVLEVVEENYRQYYLLVERYNALLKVAKSE